MPETLLTFLVPAFYINVTAILRQCCLASRADAFAAYHKASRERVDAGTEPIQAEPGAPDPTQVST